MTEPDSPTRRRRKRRSTDDNLTFRLPDPAIEQRLASHIGIAFANPYLLRLALTHRSVLHDWQAVPHLDATLQSNERLEFLGDALLGAIVAEYLYEQDPDADEGQLTRSRVAMVRAETLVHWSRELGIQHALYLGTGEHVTESARDRMLAGAFEALTGAIYLDQGRDAVERFILGFLERDADAIRTSNRDANPKGHLQELMQERTIATPEYISLATEGPDHARHFTEAVIVEGQQLGIGTGRSRRVAQQAAARMAIKALESAE